MTYYFYKCFITIVLFKDLSKNFLNRGGEFFFLRDKFFKIKNKKYDFYFEDLLLIYQGLL